MASFTETTHWRDSARSLRFFVIDAKAAFPFALLALHLRVWTFLVAVASTVFFAILQHFGFSIPIFRRVIRGALSGGYKTARPWWKQ